LPKEALNSINLPLHYKAQAVFDRTVIHTENINSIMDVLFQGNVDLTHLQVETPDLETVFLNLTGRRLRE
jgi:hypothetical protein